MKISAAEVVVMPNGELSKRAIIRFKDEKDKIVGEAIIMVPADEKKVVVQDIVVG